MAFRLEEILVLPPKVQAASVNSPDMQNDGARGVIVVFDITAVPTVDTVTPKIQGKDPVSGKYYDIVSAAAQVAVATIVLKVYPGITVAANLAVSDVLPRTWRLVVTHSAGTNFTYSAGGIYIP